MPDSGIIKMTRKDALVKLAKELAHGPACDVVTLGNSHRDDRRESFQNGFHAAVELLLPVLKRTEEMSMALPPNAISMELRKALADLDRRLEVVK